VTTAVGGQGTRVLRWLLPVLVLLVMWEVVSRLGVGDPALLSSPSLSLNALFSLAMMRTSAGYSVLLLHVLSSVSVLAVSLLVSSFAGVLTGTLMGLSERVYRFLDPLLTVLMPVPGIAWAPVFMLWLGFGAPTIVAAGALAAFFPLAYNTATGVRSIDPKLLIVAHSMGASRLRVMLSVCIPGAAPAIVTGLSLGFARGWRTVIAVEMIAARLWGLGYMIMEAREYLRPSLIYGGIIIVAIVFLLLERLVVRRLEKTTVERWGMVSPLEK